MINIVKKSLPKDLGDLEIESQKVDFCRVLSPRMENKGLDYK